MAKTSCGLQPRFPFALTVQIFPLSEANRALNALKNDAILVLLPST